MSPTPEQCVARYIELRDAKKAHEAVMKAKLAEFDGALEAIENHLLAVMIERKEVQIKTTHGTAFQSPQIRAKLVDREALVDYSPLQIIWLFLIAISQLPMLYPARFNPINLETTTSLG